MAGGAIRAGKAFVELVLNDKTAKGLRRAQNRLRGYSRTVTSLGSTMVGLGGTLAAPMALAIKQAAEAQEVVSKFNTVFGSNSEAMKAWADNFANEIGRSKVATAGFLASTQDLLVPMGFAADNAEDMSKQITTLAVDLASFNNKADADVINDLQAALTGSGEVMKKYGVIVSQAAVNQELLNQSIDPKKATEAEKAMARFQIILRGTTAAQGDAARTADSFTNKMKALQAKIADTSVEIGTALLPVVTPLVEKAAELVKQFSAWAMANKETLVTIAKVTAGVLATGVALVGVGKILGGVAAAFGALRIAMTFLIAHPAIAALTLIAAGAAAVTLAMSQVSTATRDAAKAMADLVKAGDRQRQEDQLRFQVLQKLAAKQKLSNEEMGRAEEIIKKLQGEYGDLGLSINSATGAIEGMTEAQVKLNDAMKEAALADIRAEREAVQARIEYLIERQQTTGVSTMDFFTGEVGANEAESVGLLAKLKALTVRERAIKSGDQDAITGPAQTDLEKLQNELNASTTPTPTPTKQGSSYFTGLSKQGIAELSGLAKDFSQTLGEVTKIPNVAGAKIADVQSKIQNAISKVSSGEGPGSGPKTSVAGTFNASAIGALGAGDARSDASKMISLLTKIAGSNKKIANKEQPAVVGGA